MGILRRTPNGDTTEGTTRYLDEWSELTNATAKVLGAEPHAFDPDIALDFGFSTIVHLPVFVAKRIISLHAGLQDALEKTKQVKADLSVLLSDYGSAKALAVALREEVHLQRTKIERQQELLREYADVLRLLREGKPIPVSYLEDRIHEAIDGEHA